MPHIFWFNGTWPDATTRASSSATRSRPVLFVELVDVDEDAVGLVAEEDGALEGRGVGALGHAARRLGALHHCTARPPTGPFLPEAARCARKVAAIISISDRTMMPKTQKHLAHNGRTGASTSRARAA